MTARPSSAVRWRDAVLCVPALASLIGVGAWIDDPVAGAIAAGAAFSVGFGAARAWRRGRGAMVAAAAGMTIATLTGSLAGRDVLLSAIVVVLAAAACAMLALYDEDLWWIVLQWVIALLVARAYAGPLDVAGTRTLDVLVGGVVQIAMVAALASLVPSSAARAPPASRVSMPTRTALLVHGARALVAVSLALVAARAFDLANAYWAPMTVLLILKPGLHATQSRGLERLAGTVAGCAAATLFGVVVHESRVAMAMGFLLMAGVAFALQKARYAAFSAALTASIVLLISIGQGGVLASAEHRILATLLGGAIALLVARLGPADRQPAGGADRVGG